MKKKSLYDYYFMFIIVSMMGWVIEGLWTLIKKGVLINHSAVVIGPFNVAYGICAIFLTALLLKYKDSSYLKIFLIGFIGGSILEYLMSLGMELVLGFTAWDYSEKFLNINGRIALMYSVFWGLISVAWIKWGYPFVEKVINKIDEKKGKIFLIIFSVFFLFDILLTFSAINRARALDNGIPASNSYEKFLDKTFNRKYLTNMFNENW